VIRRALAAVGLAAAALALAPPAPGAAQAAPGGGDGPTIRLLDQPVVVAPDGDFPVFLEVTDAPEGAQIAVDIYGAVQPGEEVGPEPDSAEATFPTYDLPDAADGDAQTTAFTIHLYTDGQRNPDPAWGWKITEPGVYPVRVLLLDADGNRERTFMTSLIRLPEPDQRVTATGAALLVGVHRAPPEDPAARASADTADRSLLDELRPILQVLADRPELPATLSITPNTLARIAGDDDATDDLTLLRSQLLPEGRTLLDAPYVDVDAASMVSADLAETLTLQRDFGRQTLSDLLERPVSGTWQLRNRVDEATLAQLRARGVTRTILPGDALAAGAGVLAPVDLPAGGGTTRAVSASSTYTVGVAALDDPILAAHRLLARLAATGPGPTGTPGVVVTVDPALASEQTLTIVADALTFGSPFFRATELPTLLDAPPAAARAAPTTPAQPVLGTYPLTYRRAQAALDSYGSMVGGRRELIRPYDLRLTVSAAQDLPLEQRHDDAASVTEALQVPFTSIDTPDKEKVTLGAADGQFPLPVESSLDHPVKAVIELEANDRVEFPSNRIETVLSPGSTLVPIKVKTRAAGDTPVRITVRSPDDGVILAESQYTIRSTAVSGVGIVLTVGAALFLAVWWGRHWRRSRSERLRAAEIAAAAAATEAEAEAEDAAAAAVEAEPSNPV
jgi:hypothetical protein